MLSLWLSCLQYPLPPPPNHSSAQFGFPYFWSHQKLWLITYSGVTES
jgi:hypothetical protein